MIVLRSTLEARIKDLNEHWSARYDDANYFYQAQIKALNAQIEDLRKMVFPTTTQTFTLQDAEADAVLSGSEKSPEISEAEHNRLLEESREADLLVSGNYDLDLLQ